jgi:hypothetical protein
VSDALDFLQAWIPGGPYTLGAISPDDSGHEWLTTRDLAKVSAFIDAQSVLGRNLYLQPNIARPDLNSVRCSEADVVQVLAVHAEIDPPKRIDSAIALTAWQASTTTDLLDLEWWPARGLPAPSVIAFTGTGFAVLWRLEDPVTLWSGAPLAQSRTAVEVVKRRNRKMVELIGADPASVDLGRLLRLPGTLNYPSKSKRTRYGRSAPVPAMVLDMDLDRVCTLEDLPEVEAAPVTATTGMREFAGLPSPGARATAIAALGDAWPFSGRHVAQLALAGALARAAWPVDAIAEFCAAVAEHTGAAGELHEKRYPAARMSLEKVASGDNVSGWPSLVETLGEDAVGAATAALGLGGGARGDDAFAAALIEAGTPAPEVVEPPTNADLDAGLLRAERALARSKKTEDIRDAGLLKRVRRKMPLADHLEDVDRCTAYALIAMTRAVPAETPDLAIAERVLSCRPDHTIEALLKYVKNARAAARKQDAARPGSPGSDEFAIELSGPRAGQPKNTQGNLDIALRRLGVDLAYDEFAHRKMITRDGETKIVEDPDINRMFFEIEDKFGFRPDAEYWLKFVFDRAWMNRFHPVRQYLDDLPTWSDGEAVAQELLETWLIRAGGAEDTPYTRAISRLVLVAAVRRVRQPGCKFDEVVVLEGEQGGKKSMALQKLCPRPEWHTSNLPLGEDTKTLMEHTDGKWIIEASELAGLSKADTNKLKSYLSRDTDEARMAYGHERRRSLRQFIAIATTNDDQYLRDPTGNRRWWPVRVKSFDVEWIENNRDALWAAASYLNAQHSADEYIRLDPGLYGAASDEQSKREMDDPMRVVLEGLFGARTGRVIHQDVWRVLGWDEGKMPKKSEAAGITDAMRQMGWRSERRMVAGVRSWWFERGSPAERATAWTITGSSSFGGWQLHLASEPRQEGTPGVTSPLHRTESGTVPAN